MIDRFFSGLDLERINCQVHDVLNCTLQCTFVTLLLIPLQKITGFHWMSQTTFRNHCGKRRNCSIWAISHFSTMIFTLPENNHSISFPFILPPVNFSNLGKVKKSCRLVMGLMARQKFTPAPFVNPDGRPGHSEAWCIHTSSVWALGFQDHVIHHSGARNTAFIEGRLAAVAV